MYSGFVSPKRVVKRIGIHQRFDMRAYKLISPYISPSGFPALADVLHFEGLNGPDGLKVKSPGENEPNHLWDPDKQTGEVPLHIKNHYAALVVSLRQKDLIRAAFEAGWLAHYITDGLTPAHHFPLEEELEMLLRDEKTKVAGKNWALGHTPLETLRKNWRLWGGKGLVSTHFNFEMGVATALLVFPIKGELLESDLARARQIGPVKFFKEEAAEIAKLKLYDRFIEKGWTTEVASVVRKTIAPSAAQTIAIIWLLAYLEAGQKAVQTS